MLRMFKEMKKLILFLFATMVLSLSTYAQSRLTVGGYGEVALTRNFYSDNVYRYSSASAHAGESHGRFDIPHAVIYLVYSFALHGSSLKIFRNPTFFHIYAILAFLSVLVTYFGVNLILGGMHAYA